MHTHRKHVFSLPIPIRWGDQDALGHVNNAVYFRYMEQIRIEWLASLQLDVATERETYPVIVNASCTFLLPLVHPGTVECRLYTGVCGRSSLPTYYEMRRSDDERLFAEGAAKIVWVHRNGKSVPLPEIMRRQGVDPSGISS
ncbi:MAG TPA: thioesterase family protein [Rhodocyclaceae bacterium]|nr:thioesterase family protein [Rhodocyclaceae bacterium]